MTRARTARRTLTVTTSAAAAALTSLAFVPSTAGAAPAGSSAPRSAVIVVLKDQLAATPATPNSVGARRVDARSAQDAVLARLSGPAPARVVHYTLGNAFSARVTAAQAQQLAADPAVASVTADRSVRVPAPSASPPTAQRHATPSALPGPSTVDPRACSSDRAHPLLEPEALQTINARSSDPSAKTAAQLGITGAGVKVAFIADGINPQNKGFIRKNGKSSIVDYKDFYGTGPNAPTGGAEAFGDASAISAQGNVVYDVADYSNPSVVKYPGGHCYIRIVGVAPGADVVALKAGSELLPNSAILQAIDYAVTVAKVDVINESFGGNSYPDLGTRNTIQLFDENAVAAGVTVVTSTGDAGITNTIGNPGTDPKVISAGASTDSRLYEQTGYALATRFGNGRWLDSNTSALSSAGLTQGGRTIDLDAPGEADWAVCDSSGNFTGCTSFGNPEHPYSDIQAFGGTSQSSPLTAGVAALVIQAYRKTHGGGSPTPAVVKRIIVSTARDLGLPATEQGAGLIDARAAVEAAMTWPGGGSARAGVASNIALSPTQLTLSGAPGSSHTAKITVRNVGTKTQSIVTSARRYARLSHDVQSKEIDANGSNTVPYPTNGTPWVVKKFTFTVPSGADELSSTIRWRSGAGPNEAGPVVRLSLFTPDGTYAGNTRPQGGVAPANYGLVTIKRPAAGTWTGVLYTQASVGFTGRVGIENDTFRAVPAGSISPITTTLAPGRSKAVTVRFTVPSIGGDDVDTVSVGSSDGHQVAVPVVLRAVVPTASGTGVFAGRITGGNARAFSPAQTFAYDFDVPAGKRDLAVAVTLAKDAGDLIEGVLIDPHGEVPSINTNQTLNDAYKPVQTRSLRNVVAAPVPGRWRYVVVVQNPVSGGEFSQLFVGTVKFDQVRVSGLKVPARIPAGSAVTRMIKVSNTGPAPMLVQTDARTDGYRHLQLAPQFAGSTISLPLTVEDLSSLPAYLVPPDTKSLALTTSSTVPAQVELPSPAGGIDVFGDLRSAQHGSTVSTATVSERNDTVGLGYWFPYVQEIGPFGNAGAPSGTSTLVADARTKPFDRSVATSTGDPFLAAVDPTASQGAPLVIPPGASRMIKVRLTAAGGSGTTHAGVLHLVTTPIGTAAFNTTGEVVANLPYRYTVK